MPQIATVTLLLATVSVLLRYGRHGMLQAYGVGHCAVIVLAGTSIEWMERYLKYNERTKGLAVLKSIGGGLVIVGLASAGRVAPSLPIPSVVVASHAIRDEGTSFHYLPPGATADGNPELTRALEAEVTRAQLPVRCGLVWTTDAPYRETAEQLAHHAANGALAVEMQAASLFAFGVRRGVAVGLVAHVTNVPDHHDGPPFDKGTDDTDERILAAICQAGHSFLAGETRCFPAASGSPAAGRDADVLRDA